MGVPFFSGFYSKDLIINWTCIYENWVAKSVYLLLLSAAFFTTFYSIKILYLAFYSTPRSCLKKVTAVAEDNSWNLIPILILTIFALISGYVFSDLFLGYGANSIFEVQLEKNYFSLVEFINFRKKFLPLFVAMSAVVFFFFFYKYFLNLFAELLKDSRLIFCYTRLQTFFNKKWYFDYFYYYIARFFMHISYNILFKNFDKGLFEKIMVKNVIWSILKLGEKVNFIQTGSLIDYFMYITYLVAILIIIIFAINLNLTILLFLFIFYNLTMVLN
jgi:NADH:ubiquinone oxidoreductase subunit 5 (subunit L)/multisubunit Na+/H+ antiporter MnhA subunit